MRRLVLFDLDNVFWRSYHGVSADLSTENGSDTWAIHGTIRTIAAIVRRIEPTHVLICCDGGASEYRTALYPGYKSRPHAEGHDTGHLQLSMLRELVQRMGVPAQRHKGVEADDVIAAQVFGHMDDVDQIVVVSGDKDLRQLIRKNVVVFAPALGKTGQEVLWDVDAVVAKYGIMPDRLPDLLALQGDASDSIPGVPGIGPKRATLLMGKHGSLSDVLMAEEPLVKGHEREAILAFKLVYLSGQLTNVIPLEDLEFHPVRLEDEGGPRLARDLAGLELRSIETKWRAGELWADQVKFGRRLRPDPLRAAG